MKSDKLYGNLLEAVQNEKVNPNYTFSQDLLIQYKDACKLLGLDEQDAIEQHMIDTIESVFDKRQLLLHYSDRARKCIKCKTSYLINDVEAKCYQLRKLIDTVYSDDLNKIKNGQCPFCDYELTKLEKENEIDYMLKDIDSIWY